MSFSDEEFINNLRATFRLEAEDLLQTMTQLLLELENASQGTAVSHLIEAFYRAVHSLKGAARAVDLPATESVCHRLESCMDDWRQQGVNPGRQAVDLLHNLVDLIQNLIRHEDSGQPVETSQAHMLLHRLRLLASNRVEPEASDLAEKLSAQPANPAEVQASSLSPEGADTFDPGAVNPFDTLRISRSKLEARLFEAEEMVGIKSLAKQRAKQLRELADQFEGWGRNWSRFRLETESFRNRLGHLSPSASEDPAILRLIRLIDHSDQSLVSIQSCIQKLTALASQYERDRYSIDKNVDDVLDASKQLLLLPFSLLTGFLQKIVRDLSRQQDKPAELVIEGAETEIDKRILEAIKDPLIHVLRNCIDHGIETRQERMQRGKPAKASILLSVCQKNGNEVEISITDDGAGIDEDQLKAAAVQNGLLAEAEASALSHSQALQLIFASGLSTRVSATKISGRGLGLAIARASAENLGGTVTIDSTRGAGTSLCFILPLKLATLRGLIVKSADQLFVVPLLNVVRVSGIQAHAVRTVENHETVTVDGEILALARLDRVLELPSRPGRSDVGNGLQLVVLSANGKRAAFVVDEIGHEEEILIKPLNKPLVHVRFIAGMTVVGMCRAAPVLHAQDLLRAAGRMSGVAPEAIKTNETATTESAKSILVVEDSITSRVLLKSILEAAGYTVRVAVDGLDALTALREGHFDLVVSDVEMPRLNGFELTSRIRSDRRLSDLPVVLVTALESQQEREHGIEIGASAYIAKSSFAHTNLLEIIRRLA